MRENYGDVLTDHPRRVVKVPLHSPSWARFFYIAAVATACLLTWIFFIAWPYVIAVGNEDDWLTRGQALIVFSQIPAGFLYLANRLKARRALQALRADRRSPVLYLRSFESDALDHFEARSGLSTSATTKEVDLVSRFERIGPVLAIGRPGENLAQLGSARLYVADDDWQTIARRLMASARFVVIRAGNTPGIRWELARALSELPPEKIILWFSSNKDAAYAALRDVAREVLKVELPEARPKSLMTFDADWQLRPTKLETVSMDAGRDVGQSPTADNRPAVVASRLSDLLEQLEIETTSPPPFRLHPAVWVAVVVWLGLLLGGIPGERWSFGLVELLGLPHFVGSLVEGATTMLLAVGLAFVPYVRDPTRRLRPSLVLCAVLALDGYWIVAR